MIREGRSRPQVLRVFGYRGVRGCLLQQLVLTLQGFRV